MVLSSTKQGITATADVETTFANWCEAEMVWPRLREILEDGETHEWLLVDWLKDLVEEAFINGWYARRALDR